MTSEDIVIVPEAAKTAGCSATLSETSQSETYPFYTGIRYTWTLQADIRQEARPYWRFFSWEYVLENILEWDSSFPKRTTLEDFENPRTVRGYDGQWDFEETGRRDARLLISVKAIFTRRDGTGLILRNPSSNIILRNSSHIILRDE